MKKRNWITAVILCGLIFLLAGCSSSGNKTPTLTLDGSYELVLGKSSIKEVQENGFSNRLSYSDKDVIEAKTWNQFYPMKDDLSYGTMMAGNKSSNKIPLEEGVVFELSLDYIDSDYELGSVMVDGVDYRGYTKDQIKEVMKDANPSLDTDEYLTYKSKNSAYTFHFKDGSETLSRLTVKDGTEKNYVMK